MSKASTSSIQHLLRQLYHAKNSVASAAASASTIEAAATVGSSSVVISGSSHCSAVGGPSSPFSTVASARGSLHAQSNPSANDSYHHPAPSPISSSTPTGEWATTNSGSNSSHAAAKARKSATSATTHHYHRHNANRHHVASANVLPSNAATTPFWIQPGGSGSSSNGGGSNGTIPPFTSNSNPSGYAITPSNPSTSSSSSSTSTIPATSASNPQFSDATHVNDVSTSSTIASTSNSSYPGSGTLTSNDATSENSSNKTRQSSHHHLTLHPGAYGIPKRLSALPTISSVKGKEREAHPNESIQTQIDQMRQSSLSVQVGEDAYFIRHDALGVADGVGGWSGRKGADPGLFAARLMHHCSAELALLEEEQQLRLEQEKERIASSSSSTTKPTLAPSSSSDSKTKLTFVSSATSTSNQDKASDTANASQETSARRETAHNASPPSQPHASQESTHTASKDSKAAGGDPIEILHKAWDLTLSEFFEMELIGSSTALIALLKDDELRLANIGDCSCSIVRRRGATAAGGDHGTSSITTDGSTGVDSTKAQVAMEGEGEEGSGEYEYIFRSQEQQHSFNYPFQMGTNSKDTPRKDGQFFNVKIQKDDLIIISSDGLVDNLFDEDILEEIERQSHESSSPTTSASTLTMAQQENGYDTASIQYTISPERLSKALCSRAKAVSEDQRAVTSPFQQKANEEGIHFVGGKHDDITVLVAIIGDK